MTGSWYDTLSAMNGEFPETDTEPTSANIEAMIIELQHALAKAKEREAAAKAGVYVYAWDIYLDPADKGRWASSTYDVVYATERDAYNAGRRELTLCDREGSLESAPEDYTIDTIKIPVSDVSAKILANSGLDHLLKSKKFCR